MTETETAVNRPKAKVGRPYKNPHHVLPPGITIIGKAELIQLRETNAELLAALKWALGHVPPHFKADATCEYSPYRSAVAAIAKTEGQRTP